MHDIVVTEGIVLRKRAVGEAHVQVFVFTRDLGLVRAKATSARAETSKLRYGLEPLTRARFSFVKGRSEWRLVGVEQVSREFVSAPLTTRNRLGQVSALLTRLIVGAEPSPDLYAVVSNGFDTLARVSQDADSVECVLVLRILSQLGYLPQLPLVTPFVESDTYSAELAAQAADARKNLIKLINESLQASGL